MDILAEVLGLDADQEGREEGSEPAGGIGDTERLGKPDRR